jgi:hypothetical protein
MKPENQPAIASTEKTHTYVCPECGETIDPGNLTQALYHARAAHKYDAKGRTRTGIATASLNRAWDAADSNSRS